MSYEATFESRQRTTRKRGRVMKKIKVTIDVGSVRHTIEDEFEIDDNATEEEIQEMVDAIVYTHIEVYWREDEK